MVSRDPNSKTIGVLVADDHPVVRQGLRAVLSAEPGIKVLGEASDGFQAADMAARLKPDVVIMDIYMPLCDGLKSMISIKSKLPEVKVLLLTVSDREDDLLQALRFGADGYTLKTGNVAGVVEAVRKIARGEATLPPQLAGELVKDILAKQGSFGLSAREKEILGLLGDGLTNSDIAQRLVLSQKTVSTYIYRLLQKLHLHNRGEAIAYSVRHVKHSEPF
ncbi:MAG: response regulator transcription factor [Chloroflexi bacterium]|nr:response regulator transcription factor [Chloroflexota bacterium]